GAVPFACAALPPLLAISRCLSRSIDAKPRESFFFTASSSGSWRAPDVRPYRALRALTFVTPRRDQRDSERSCKRRTNGCRLRASLPVGLCARETISRRGWTSDFRSERPSHRSVPALEATERQVVPLEVQDGLMAGEATQHTAQPSDHRSHGSHVLGSHHHPKQESGPL